MKAKKRHSAVTLLWLGLIGSAAVSSKRILAFFMKEIRRNKPA